MRPLFLLLLSVLISQSHAVSATLEQFWPWLAPNPLAFGTSFAAFSQSHPTAVNFSTNEQKPGVPFIGDLTEALPDGSFFSYGFWDDKLAAVGWGAPPSHNTAKLVITVRNSLLGTCGEPTFGTTGRIKARGGLARIVWETYKPKVDKNYLITLRATSESGIEVMLINEIVAKKRGIKTLPPSYEEVEQTIPSVVKTEEPASEFIDLLAAARADAEQPKSVEPQTPDLKTIENPPQSPPKVSPKLMPSPETPPAPAKPPSFTWLWWLGGLSLAVLAFIANALRKRRR